MGQSSVDSEGVILQKISVQCDERLAKSVDGKFGKEIRIRDTVEDFTSVNGDIVFIKLL